MDSGLEMSFVWVVRTLDPLNLRILKHPIFRCPTEQFVFVNIRHLRLSHVRVQIARLLLRISPK